MIEEILRKIIREELAALKAAPSVTEGFVSKRTAANLLDCKPSTIDSYARKGLLKKYFLGNTTTVRFSKVEVLGWIRDKPGIEVIRNNPKKKRGMDS